MTLWGGGSHTEVSVIFSHFGTAKVFLYKRLEFFKTMESKESVRSRAPAQWGPRPPRLPQVWLCSRSLHLPVLTRCWRSLPSSRPGPQHGARPLLPRCPQTARTRQAGAIDLTEGAGAVVGGWGWRLHHRASKDIRHNGMFLRQDLETRFAFLPWKSAPPLASDPCRRVSGEA